MCRPRLLAVTRSRRKIFQQRNLAAGHPPIIRPYPSQPGRGACVPGRAGYPPEKKACALRAIALLDHLAGRRSSR